MTQTVRSQHTMDTPIRTPTVGEFIALTAHLPVTPTWHAYGDEPTIRVTARPDARHEAAQIALAHGLHVLRSSRYPSIDVTGFDQDWPARPRLAPVEQPTQFCKGCGAEFLDDGHDYCVRCWDCLRDADWDHDDEEAQP